jgi:hypothetical protein
MDHTEDAVSNNSSIVVYVFIAAVTVFFFFAEPLPTNDRGRSYGHQGQGQSRTGYWTVRSAPYTVSGRTGVCEWVYECGFFSRREADKWEVK